MEFDPILARRREFYDAKRWLNTPQSLVFVEDIGSLFESMPILPDIGTHASRVASEMTNALIQISSMATSEWQWTVASEQLNNKPTATDLRLYLVTYFFAKSDAMLYRLSSNAVIIRSFDHLDRLY